MANDELFPAAATAPAAGAAREDDAWLLQQYEPVLRFTQGELFLPMPVENYLESCSLWRAAGPRRAMARRGAAERLCAPGELTPARLAQLGASSGQDLSLRFVERGLRRRELRAWRSATERPRLAAGTSRFAAVGLLGRLIDAVLRLSLLARGRVPGGTAAAADQQYRAHGDPDDCPYYGRVTRDRGFLALQYWFFYAMNDWRSTFGGVNDHEADWEQVTVFLPDPPDPSARPAWVAFSSHDEVGDDLRRRADDPDLQWQGIHPVVFAGAGSHSGACLPGDYLVTVEPPALGRLLAAPRRLSRLLLPWTRGYGGTAFGIPFIDYRRGDGAGVGPGEAKKWRPVIVDDDTPWLRDYRGLWGLDSGDPFGGERAPAGPRYERGGSVRLCWSDPVGWAGLDKEPPCPAAEKQAIDDRITELDAQLSAAAAELGDRGNALRRARVGLQALGSTGPGGDQAVLAALETSVQEARARRQALADEREALARAALHGLPRQEPHAHLRHRALPNVDPVRTRRRVLRVWSAVSASFLLAGLAVVILGHLGELIPAIGAVTVVMLCTEAFARGHLARFIAGLLAVAVVATAAWLAVWAALGHWRAAAAALLILAAVALLLARIRDFFVKR
jgi:transposase-like protein